MTTDNTSSVESRLRRLPSVDALLRTPVGVAWQASAGHERLARLARETIEEMRAELRKEDVRPREAAQPTYAEKAIESANISSDIATHKNSLANEDLHNESSLLAEAARRFRQKLARDAGRGTKRVINATGVVLHTNLGRAPLSADARRAICEDAAGYCALEYDLETGARGRRGERAEHLLCELTGAKDALVVNNCAAAALLVITALARDGETIVSRGELVEIGGDFRVPDVMAQSGTRMIEVGTTNRTSLEDYRRAVSERTKLLMRVHPSNYRIVGFTHAPALAELATLARETNVWLYEDAGSGALVDLTRFGLKDEPVIRRSIEAGANVVTFSADKLLGAAQAGLIVGERELIHVLRRHPLYRALRASKITLAALEATLEAYSRGAAFDEVPTLRMIATTYEELRARAENFINRAQQRNAPFDMEIIEGESAIGGGAAPLTHPRTALIAVVHRRRYNAHELESRLRCASLNASRNTAADEISNNERSSGTPPVITRIVSNKVALDLRTMSDEDESALLDILCEGFN